MSHTPGPWTTMPTSHGGLIVVRGGALEHPQHMLQIVPKADARLIAAAPDLLASARDAEAYINDNWNVGGEPEVLTTLRAAIAKAEGRS